MRIFIDESGSFQVPKSADDHSAAVVVGVVVPEIREQALLEQFARFVSGLDKSERNGSGEPKGSRLSSANRARFADILGSVPGVMILPVTADLSDLAGHAEELPLHLSKSLREHAAICVHQTMRDEVLTLSRQIANLSAQEVLKLLLYTESIQECVHHAVLYLSEPPYRDCWSTVDILIDRLTKNPTGREKQVFKVMLLSWLTAWSASSPLTLIKKVHTADHPFVQRFDTEAGIDMRLLVGEGLRWVDSAQEPGVQIADIAAAITFSAVHDLRNHDNRWPEFLSLMCCCPYVPEDGPGFVTLLPDGHTPHVAKYVGLVRALAAKFPKRQWQYRGLRQMRQERRSMNPNAFRATI